MHKTQGVLIMDIVLERILSLLPKKPDGKYVHGAKKAFCESIDAPVNIISEWEKGVTKSYRNYIHKIAMVYNVSVEWLEGKTDKKEALGTNNTEGLSAKKIAAIERIKSMPSEEIERKWTALSAIFDI